MLLQWDVWKVIDTPQEDFTHMVTYIYDIEKYPNETTAYDMVGMSNLQWATIQEKVNQMRKKKNTFVRKAATQNFLKPYLTLARRCFYTKPNQRYLPMLHAMSS